MQVPKSKTSSIRRQHQSVPNLHRPTGHWNDSLKDGHEDFEVLENMDSYRDEGLGDIIVGRPFCKDACIKARRFNGMITIYKGNDSVNAQDELKSISNPYLKLKGFYKEFLNLGPKYIKDDKVEEWFTCGHVSVHEME
ncbi:hypothetical protein Tco_0854988 [Tanacetum coccineum]